MYSISVQSDLISIVFISKGASIFWLQCITQEQATIKQQRLLSAKNFFETPTFDTFVISNKLSSHLFSTNPTLACFATLVAIFVKQLILFVFTSYNSSLIGCTNNVHMHRVIVSMIADAPTNFEED